MNILKKSLVPWMIFLGLVWLLPSGEAGRAKADTRQQVHQGEHQRGGHGPRPMPRPMPMPPPRPMPMPQPRPTPPPPRPTPPPGQRQGQPGFTGWPTAPGKSGAAGKPYTPGKSGAYGKPSMYGKSGQLGKPSMYGKSGAYGKPSKHGKPGLAGQPGGLGKASAQQLQNMLKNKNLSAGGRNILNQMLRSGKMKRPHGLKMRDELSNQQKIDLLTSITSGKVKDPLQIAVLQKLASNQPLSPMDMVIAANMGASGILGGPGSGAQQALMHGLTDNMILAASGAGVGGGGGGIGGIGGGGGIGPIISPPYPPYPPEPVVIEPPPIGPIGTVITPTGTDTDTGSDEGAGQPARQQVVRYLRIHNETGEALAVFVQYRTLTTKDVFQWFPAVPGQSTEAVRFDIEPGAEVDLVHDGWRLNASRVRLWAVAKSGVEWMDFKDADLWLVPEKDAAGGREYYAPEIETFVYTFQGAEPSGGVSSSERREEEEPAENGNGVGSNVQGSGVIGVIGIETQEVNGQVTSAGEAPEQKTALSAQVERSLQMKNLTGKKLTVYVQYRTRTDDGDWAWYPADPRKSDKTIRFDVLPGGEICPLHRGLPIQASRIRFWAVSSDGTRWEQCKYQDLWLVPQNGKGLHRYFAADVQSFPLVFANGDETAPDREDTGPSARKAPPAEEDRIPDSDGEERAVPARR